MAEIEAPLPKTRPPDSAGESLAPTPRPKVVRDFLDARQIPLFKPSKPSSREIRELVKDKLYGFKIRQAARDKRREELNADKRLGKQLARKGRSARA